MTPPASSPLPVAQILGEIGRLHWHHVLVFLAAAVLYAVPVTLIAMPVVETMASMQGQQMPTPEQIEQFSSQGFLALLVVPLLTAALFWFWVRLTLMGPRSGWRNEGISHSLVAVLKIAGLFVVAIVAAVIGIFPLTIVIGLLAQNSITLLLTLLVVTFGTCLSFSLFSRRLVQLALEIPRTTGAPHPLIGMQQHLRLAALFTAATFGLYLVQSIVILALSSAGATLTAQVATGILSTATITVYASIHAIVYRMRTVPPAHA